MPRQYSSDEKAAALVQLERNGGDVSLTAQQTHISERTFHAWTRSILPYLQQYPPPRQEQAELPPFEDDLEMLAFVREQIMAELVRLSLDIRRSSLTATPYQRVIVLSQLMDRLMKLDQHLKPYQEPEFIHMSWDTGIYVRAKEGYHGPFYPSDLPKRWKELFGQDATLEMYWSDNTVSLLPEGPVTEAISRLVKLDPHPNRHPALLTPEYTNVEWDKLAPPEPGGDVYAPYRFVHKD